jgi:hypothetical protein
MAYQNFSVNIIVGGQLVPSDENGHVLLHNGDEYNISMTNNNNFCKCDAEIKIDNVSIGIFRIDTNKTTIIERPIKTINRFKFVSLPASDKFYDVNDKNQHNGIISVIFKPEIEPDPMNINSCDETVHFKNKIIAPIHDNDIFNDNNGDKEESVSHYGNINIKPGMTVLSNNVSGQTIVATTKSINHDLNRMQTINLRLVVINM